MPYEPERTTSAERQAWLQSYLPRLRAFVRARLDPSLRRRVSASDVVQSLCREVLEGKEPAADRGETAFRSWLFTAALNKVRKKVRFHTQRKRSLRREDSAQFALRAAAADLPDPGEPPSAAAMMRERAEILDAALATLSEPDREIILHSRLMGVPIAEVAARMGKNVEAARKQLGRALGRLATELERRLAQERSAQG